MKKHSNDPKTWGPPKPLVDKAAREKAMGALSIPSREQSKQPVVPVEEPFKLEVGKLW